MLKVQLIGRNSLRQVRTAASSCERISPHHHVRRPQSLCLGKAIQLQSRGHLCNAVVRVRHQRPAAAALAGQSSSFSLLPHRALLCSFLCNKTANASNLKRPARQCLIFRQDADRSGLIPLYLCSGAQFRTKRFCPDWTVYNAAHWVAHTIIHQRQPSLGYYSEK
jgi:hypothetical protein